MREITNVHSRRKLPKSKHSGESDDTAEGRRGSRARAELFSPRKGGVVTGRCNRAYDDHGQPDLARQNSDSRSTQKRTLDRVKITAGGRQASNQ